MQLKITAPTWKSIQYQLVFVHHWSTDLTNNDPYCVDGCWCETLQYSIFNLQFSIFVQHLRTKTAFIQTWTHRFDASTNWNSNNWNNLNSEHSGKNDVNRSGEPCQAHHENLKQIKNRFTSQFVPFVCRTFLWYIANQLPLICGWEDCIIHWSFWEYLKLPIFFG